jgi:seryl-tRNA synthetase
MLDIKLIRENPEIVRQAIANRHDTAPLDEILHIDKERRKKMTELEELRRNRKQTSREKQAEAAEEGRAIRNKIRDLEEETRILETQLNQLMLQIPNIPDSRVPIGKNDSENPVVKIWGEPKNLDFIPKAHWDIGPALGIIDFERGVKISGTRFYILRGLGARLQRAIIAFMLDLHVSKHGYTEI